MIPDPDLPLDLPLPPESSMGGGAASTVSPEHVPLRQGEKLSDTLFPTPGLSGLHWGPQITSGDYRPV